MARLRLHRCVLLLDDQCRVSLRDRVNEASPYIKYKGRLEVTATQAKSGARSSNSGLIAKVHFNGLD